VTGIYKIVYVVRMLAVVMVLLQVFPSLLVDKAYTQIWDRLHRLDYAHVYAFQSLGTAVQVGGDPASSEGWKSIGH